MEILTIDLKNENKGRVHLYLALVSADVRDGPVRAEKVC